MYYSCPAIKARLSVPDAHRRLKLRLAKATALIFVAKVTMLKLDIAVVKSGADCIYRT